MARPLWKGSVTFGLVHVPVRMYAAVSAKDLHFNMLHDADGARIRQKRVCEKDGEEVPYEHIVKGYEVAKGQYVTVEPKELEAFAAKASHTIDIEDFVDMAEIDPVYFAATYHLAPERNAAKAYALLTEAMKTTGRVGIGRLVLRTKQYVCAVRPVGDGLALSTMFHADEIIPQQEIEELAVAPAPPGERELKMAQQLVESLTAPFQPEKYPDVFRERVLELIHKKAEGQQLIATPAPASGAPVVDLMEALKRSLATAPATPARRGQGERRLRAEAARRVSARKRDGR